MDQSQQPPASNVQPSEPTSRATNERQPSEAVQQYIARMVAALNNFKARA